MAHRRISLAAQAIVLVVVLFTVNAFLGFMLSRQSEASLTEQIRTRMMDVASSAAALLNGDELAAFTAQDVRTPAFEQAREKLRAFQDNAELAYIYCVRKVGEDSFVFTVDPDEVEPAGFGESAEYTAALGQAGKGTASIDLVAHDDRWGRFYSAYCPVFDSQGNVAGIVCVDMSASWFEERTAEFNRLALINLVVSLVMALVAAFLVIRSSRAEAKHMENLMRANRRDPLTGLANMSYFFELAETFYHEMLSRGEAPVMLYVDLIGMKFFNQKRGFAEGDELLKALAELLAQSFGRERCSRFGQDNFVVSTNNENLDERLDCFIEQCASINGGKSLPVRIGIYVATSEHIAVSVACDRAKAANMENSGSYRSVYSYYNDEMLARVERRQYFLDNLDRAIEEGWIQVHYQPIVRATTGKVCDEEALARWVDPERGLLSPAEFIPALEDAKLVYKLDLNVLDQVLDKMQRMAEAGLHVVSASINLSRSDFEACDIVEEVRTRVDASAIERSQVNIEITETALVSDFEFMSEQVERFHELGFQVWMDDFGSEYSSLDYLQSLRFDLLKLDMRFMRQFDKGEKSRIIITELVKMALGLGIDTVAEGVETQEQADFLREVGCSKLQGFYYSRPLPFEEILQRYENGLEIGFENPAESGYYSTLGRVSLFDLSSIARVEEDEGLRRYFDAPPMAIVETAGEYFAVLRFNESYRDFLGNAFGEIRVNAQVSYAEAESHGESAFLNGLRKCGKNGGQIIVDESTPDGALVHSIIRRVAVNPVSGAAAVVIAVLTAKADEGI